eukprot:3594860-Prymnesium_polylepis.2
MGGVGRTMGWLALMLEAAAGPTHTTPIQEVFADVLGALAPGMVTQQMLKQGRRSRHKYNNN